jgi:hypothetical protein
VVCLALLWEGVLEGEHRTTRKGDAGVCVCVCVHEQGCSRAGLWEFVIVQLCESVPRNECVVYSGWARSAGYVCELILRPDCLYIKCICVFVNTCASMQSGVCVCR